MKSGAMTSPDKSRTKPKAGFHDTAAREAYASWFKPIAIPAVAAGTRPRAPELRTGDAERRTELPGVLRHGFDD
ncbi:MAG: hypothetical protein DI527_17375 [Chelatococcus sp.]|nr:MAG: hypothetical protein DI527_17375 [Chelatococcus sp.]